MLTLSTQPSPQPEPRRELDDLMAHPELITALVRAVENGAIEGINAAYGFRGTQANYHKGVFSSHYSSRNLTNAVASAPHNFVPDHRDCQVRMISPPGYSPNPFRLLYCHGRQEGARTRGNEKGRLSAYLINQENARFGPQPPLPLYPDEPVNADARHNFWIVSELGRDNSLTIYAVFPIAMEDKRTFNNLDFRELHRGDLGGTNPQVLDVPPSVDTPVLLMERTGTDG